ncbi:hypothetical protein IscW_ISCW020509 [Ixodes scapularis]|uniref:Uncharacterized protein n=1 Tax=Ixodes scapularis TaxID=6945 RepID=B7Q1F0_IXOSC|nr:hypothetical protein IscW_ISCW020509 [Ixodes scapularis]|eukprot:XP_002409589.1 hypothetical protein IscW_ISCW020509 [Ixodes scapularis]
MHTSSSAFRRPLTGQLLPGSTTAAVADGAAKRGRRRSLFAEPTRGHGGHGGGLATAFPKISEVGNPSLLRCVPRRTAAVAVSRPRDSPFALRRPVADDNVYDEPSPLDVRRRRIAQRGAHTCRRRLAPVNDSGDVVRRDHRYHVSQQRGDDKENRSPSASGEPAVAVPAMYAHNGSAAASPHDLSADPQVSPEKTAPMKRRKSDDGERSKKPKLETQRGCDVHGVCTLKEGSLKLKISLHRPLATPDGDCLSPAKLPHDADSGLPNDSPQSGAMHASNAPPSLPAQLEHASKYSGVPTARESGVSHLDEQLRPEPEDPARDVRVSDSFLGSSDGPLQSTTRVSGSRPRKNLSPGHYVPYTVPQNRKRLIQDTSKLKKRASNLDPAATDRTKPQQTFRHTQVGQNGGVVHHSSILDHPSVHSRMFADSPRATEASRSSPLVARLAAPNAAAKGSTWKQPAKGKANNSTVSPEEYQPLDLSKPVAKNVNLAAALARPVREAAAKTREHRYIPPIGVFYMKPRSRQRLDGVIQKLWATRNGPDKPR